MTGEGYKGHVYWDAEIFLLPFFTANFPSIGRRLLKYRYHILAGARKKARENGYEGAMFPWESAFDGDEESPERGFDLVYGKEVAFEFGKREIHIGSAVIYGLWQYYVFTKDQEFMNRYGYEMVFETAKFWASRFEYNEGRDRYEIYDVFGPDEYKQHVDNNAYTNYMAFWVLTLAMEYHEELERMNPELLKSLQGRISLEGAYDKWKEVAGKVYLPQPREDGVVPQDDTYLHLDEIDLTKYRSQRKAMGIFHDYNWEELSGLQLSKQADVLMLFLLLENMFSKEVKRANWDYYEPKTIHDASHSYSSHCVLACDMKEFGMAYDLFRKAVQVDLGPYLDTSDEGIHAAATGGIWQCVVNGFGGVRMLNGKLILRPKIPKQWKKLKYPLVWQGHRLEITVTDKEMVIESQKAFEEEITITVNGVDYQFKNRMVFEFQERI